MRHVLVAGLIVVAVILGFINLGAVAVVQDAQRATSAARDSLATARYERDDARDSLREARWEFDELAATVDRAHATVFRDSIPPGKWPRYRFAVRAFPDSSDR